MKKYIVLAGNIGAGKSTLVHLLSKDLDFTPYFEPVAENPFLKDFYTDMGRWAFHSQVFFLTSRAKAHRELIADQRSVVQDRSLYEDAEVFARNLYLQGALKDERPLPNYRKRWLRSPLQILSFIGLSHLNRAGPRFLEY